MIVFPVLAAAVALAFGLHLLLRFTRRRAPHEGLWSLAMLLYAAGSVALALGVADGWSSDEFRAYWLFGAIINVPFLFAGEAYLLMRDRIVAHGVALSVAAAAVYAGWVVATAGLDVAVLREEFPLGREVFGDGTVAHRMAQYYGWTAYLLLVGGALWSAGRMRGQEALRDRFHGTALIALGATVVAIGSGVGAGFGNFALFSTSLAAGASIMYWGFLVATRRRVTAAEPAPSGGGA